MPVIRPKAKASVAPVDISELVTLSVRRRAWLKEYLANGGDAHAAYKKVSPKASSTTCSREGYRLTRHPKIAPLIAKAKERAAHTQQVALADSGERYEHTQARVLLELHHVAYVDAAAASLKSVEQMTAAERRAIKGIERTISTKADGTRVERIRYIFHDKLQALRMLGLPLGLWTDAPPPPPPVPADQPPADAAPANDAKAAIRRKLAAMLEAMAEPAPLLEGEALPPKPNGSGQMH